MLPEFSKTSSAYQPNKPFGGIATGDSGYDPSAKGPMPASVPSIAPNASYQRHNTDGTTTTIQGYNGSALPGQKMGSGTNDNSLTNSYLNALKSQQGATAAKQSLSGYTAPDPNQTTPALSELTPEQQQQFQSVFGSILGQPTGQPPTGLNAVTPATTPQALVAGDNSRFVNDPFKTNMNALR